MRGVGVIGLQVACVLFLGVGMVRAQDLPLTQELKPSTIAPLDPTRDIQRPPLESAQHQPLPEEYIWTADDANANDKVLYTRPNANERTEPHYFRRQFTVTMLESA